MRLKGLFSALVASVCWLVLFPATANADDGVAVAGNVAEAWAKTKVPGHRTNPQPPKAKLSSPPKEGRQVAKATTNSVKKSSSKSAAEKDDRKFREYLARVERVQADINRKTASYEASVGKYNNCMRAAVPRLCSSPAEPNLPSLPNSPLRAGDRLQPQIGLITAANRQPGAAATQPQIVLDPETVAYMAVANLTLTAPIPGIGPSPDLNKWKMAAVGYPLWLWADGNINPAPVRDSVYTLSVSLDARVTKIDFLMGDGNTVTCQGLGTKWTAGTPAGRESPTCGYRYQKPSLPKGKYTVTARTHWAIDWSINGQNGTIPYVQAATTQLPVGELQVLVR